MGISKQILKNTSAGWFEMLILIVSGLIIPPILLNYFGKEGYGVWILAGQLIGYLSILDLGVGNSLSRFIAKYNAKKDMKGLSRILNTSLFLHFLSMVVVLIVTFIIWPKFSDFFNLEGKYYKIGSHLILLMGCGVAISLPLRIGQGIFQGTHRYDLVYLFRSLCTFFKLLLVIIFFCFMKKGGLILLAIISISTSLLPNILMCFLARNQIPEVIIKRHYISKSTLTEIWSLSFSALVISFSALLLNKTPALIIGKLLEPETVTLFAIPFMLVTYSSMTISYILASFVPLASEMTTLGKDKQLISLNIQGVKISFVILLGFLIMTLYFGKPFLSIWLKSTALQESDLVKMSNLLLIMIAGFCIGGPQGVTAKMLLGSGRHWLVAIVSVVNNLFGLTIGYLLLRYSDMGLYGMAIGWFLVQFIAGIFIYPNAACFYLKINFRSYLKRAYLPPVISVLPLVLLSSVLDKYLKPTGFLTLFFLVGVCLSFYMLFINFICLESKHRIQFWSIVSKFKILTS